MEGIVVLGFVVVFLAVWGLQLHLRYTSADRRTRRGLLGLPATTVANAQEGLELRVKGTVGYLGDEAPLRAPISGRPCAAWRVVIEHYATSKDVMLGSGNGKSWRRIHDAQAGEAFTIADESGEAHIVGPLSLVLDYDAKGGRRWFKLSDELEAYCKAQGIWTKPRLGFSRKLRYREGILEAGEEAIVGGVGSWERDPSEREGYRGVGKRLRLGPLAHGQVVATDDSGGG